MEAGNPPYAGSTEAAVTVEEAVGLLDTALGVRLPVFAQLVGGFRARLRPAVRIETSTRATRPTLTPSRTSSRSRETSPGSIRE